MFASLQVVIVDIQTGIMSNGIIDSDLTVYPVLPWITPKVEIQALYRENSVTCHLHHLTVVWLTVLLCLI